MKKARQAQKLCAIASEKCRDDGKNLQSTRRKAAGTTLPRHIADTATGCHDEVADTKTI